MLEALKKALISVTNENDKLLQDLSNCMAKIKTLEKENKTIKHENKKLKKELLNRKDYFMENEILKYEKVRLEIIETEAQEIIAELESKLEEYKKFGLDKDLKELEKLK